MLYKNNHSLTDVSNGVRLKVSNNIRQEELLNKVGNTMEQYKLGEME